ncbi:MAG: TRAP transporter large permease subunit [bacterium]|nr:MAG: TRAP transporter large permease subunit [bacterium]
MREAVPDSTGAPGDTGPVGFPRMWRQGENLLVGAALVAMVLIPLAEIVLRAAFKVGISASTSLVQHLTLVVSMVGGAIAARENRLLSLSAAVDYLKGPYRSAAQIYSGAFALAVTALLFVAGVQFIGVERLGGTILAYGIPVWVIQLCIPAGFALISFHIIRYGADRWPGRLLVVLIAGMIITAGLMSPFSPADMVPVGLAGLILATAMGSPVFVLLGGAAVILFWGAELPIASIPLDQYRLVTNPSLPALPLFTLAGYFLAEGGAPRRLIRLFQVGLGGVRGGPAIITAVICAFFTSFTGASGVTILALGGLLMPILTASRCPERSALGLLTGSGSLGLLFPPCLPLILYAIVAKISLEEIFLGGILPGVLLVALTALWGARQCPRVESNERGFSPGEVARALWEAKWEMLLPLVALGSLFSGLATPVEAAALTALYSFLTQTVFHRDLKLSRDIPRVLTECGLLIGGVLLILSVALGFTNYLVDAQVPSRMVDLVTGAIQSPLVFLLLLNVFLIIVGCLMDIYSAIVVVVPLIVPLGAAFGIDPVHLGIIFLANLELGYLTPPVGMNLFLSSYRFDKPLQEVYRSIVPILLVLLGGVLLITYIPILTTFLPNLFYR